MSNKRRHLDTGGNEDVYNDSIWIAQPNGIATVNGQHGYQGSFQGTPLVYQLNQQYLNNPRVYNPWISGAMSTMGNWGNRTYLIERKDGKRIIGSWRLAQEYMKNGNAANIWQVDNSSNQYVSSPKPTVVEQEDKTQQEQNVESEQPVVVQTDNTQNTAQLTQSKQSKQAVTPKKPKGKPIPSHLAPYVISAPGGHPQFQIPSWITTEQLRSFGDNIPEVTDKDVYYEEPPKTEQPSSETASSKTQSNQESNQESNQKSNQQFNQTQTVNRQNTTKPVKSSNNTTTSNEQPPIIEKPDYYRQHGYLYPVENIRVVGMTPQQFEKLLEQYPETNTATSPYDYIFSSAKLNGLPDVLQDSTFYRLDDDGYVYNIGHGRNYGNAKRTYRFDTIEDEVNHFDETNAAFEDSSITNEHDLEKRLTDIDTKYYTRHNTGDGNWIKYINKGAGKGSFIKRLTLKEKYDRESPYYRIVEPNDEIVLNSYWGDKSNVPITTPYEIDDSDLYENANLEPVYKEEQQPQQNNSGNVFTKARNWVKRKTGLKYGGKVRRLAEVGNSAYNWLPSFAYNPITPTTVQQAVAQAQFQQQVRSLAEQDRQQMAAKQAEAYAQEQAHQEARRAFGAIIDDKPLQTGLNMDVNPMRLTPIGDVEELGQIAQDAKSGNYAAALAGLGLFAIPGNWNKIHKQYKIKKAITKELNNTNTFVSDNDIKKILFQRQFDNELKHVVPEHVNLADIDLNKPYTLQDALPTKIPNADNVLVHITDKYPLTVKHDGLAPVVLGYNTPGIWWQRNYPYFDSPSKIIKGGKLGKTKVPAGRAIMVREKDVKVKSPDDFKSLNPYGSVVVTTDVIPYDKIKSLKLNAAGDWFENERFVSPKHDYDYFKGQYLPAFSVYKFGGKLKQKRYLDAAGKVSK